MSLGAEDMQALKRAFLAQDEVLFNDVVESLLVKDITVAVLPDFFVNQSRWKTYADCDRLYGWIHVEDLVPDRPRKYLEFGTAVHKGMVVANEHGGTEEAFAKATQAAEAEFRKTMSGIKLPQDEVDLQDGVATIQRMLPAYYQEYKAKGQLWKPLGVELAFCVEVGEGTGVYLVGRLDNLVTYMSGLWIVDYKTMARLDRRDFLKYEIDVQLTAYIYGGTKQLTLEAKERGEPPVIIRGAIIDGLIKTAEPQFHRELYTRSIQDLREFELEFCMKTWEIAAKHAMVRKDRKAFDAYNSRMWLLGEQGGWKCIFPKNTQQCFRYGTCAFRDLCVKDNDVRRLAYKKRSPDYVDFAGMKKSGEYRAWMDPEAVAAHTPYDECQVDECLLCSVRDCPHSCELHYHHDGCPACLDEAQNARYRAGVTL